MDTIRVLCVLCGGVTDGDAQDDHPPGACDVPGGLRWYTVTVVIMDTDERWGGHYLAGSAREAEDAARAELREMGAQRVLASLVFPGKLFKANVSLYASDPDKMPGGALASGR